MRRPDWPQESKAQAAELLRRCSVALACDGVVANVGLVGVEEQPSGRWLPVFVRIDICRKEDIGQSLRYRYRRVKVASEQLAGRDFLAMFGVALEGREPMVCDGVTIHLAPEPQWDAELHSSNNDYSSWPCFYAERRLEGARVAGTVEGPFVSVEGSPYYATIWELVADVSQIRPFHGWNDARKDNLHVVIWDYRGRFADVAVGGNGQVDLRLEGNELADLIVVGRLEGAVSDQQVRATAQPTITVDPQVAALKGQLALVSSADQIVDQWIGDLQASLPKTTAIRSPDEALDRLLASGESAKLEFKPYVRLRDNTNKLDEVIETALAMSNARGGWIAIGVDDHAIPRFGSDDFKIVSREAGIEVTPGATPEQRHEFLASAVRAYWVKLRDRVQQRASKSLALGCQLLWRDQVPVLLLAVAEGADKPYLDSRDNTLWYRTNATNRRPTEHELAALFAERLAPEPSE